MNARTVRVDLAANAYDILIGEGLLETIGLHAGPLFARPRLFVIADETVAALHGERLGKGLAETGVTPVWFKVPAGEASKSFDTLSALVGALIDAGAERTDLIAAFGGGVIGDLAGFAASILNRGCRFIQIPTSLLAQVDSSVGGKTAINIPQGKNLVGSFHQPSLVLCDMSALSTLPARQVRAGFAEVAKYGAIADEPFFAWLEANVDDVLALKRAALEHAIAVSCAAKAAIVGEDEKEQGKRALLNFGHTFGHAIESFYGYGDTVLHGEAVAVGMTLAMDYSAHEKYCPAADADRMRRLIARAGLPAGLNDITADRRPGAEEMLAYMRKDKKVSDGAITLILARGIGAAFIERRAPEWELQAFLAGATRQNGDMQEGQQNGR